MKPLAIVHLLKRTVLACTGNKSSVTLGRWSSLLIVVVQLGATLPLTTKSVIAQERPTQSEGISSSEATATLKRLHDHLRNAAELNFDVSITINNSLDGSTTQASAVFLTRQPDIFRVEATLKGRKYVVVSDGKLLTISRPANRTFSQYPAMKNSLLGNMYTVAGLTNLSGRMLDFFWALDAGRDTTVSAIPSRQVEGRQCDGIRVVRFEETFDVWIEPKGDPLPCRLESRRTDGSGLTVNTYIFKWKSPPANAADTFSTTPPKGSRRVGGLELR